MRKSVFIVLGGLVLMGALFFAAQRVASHLCCTRLAAPTDDLDWLRREFHLSDAELATVKKLHDGYLPKCQEYCEQIAAAKKELATLLENSPTVSPAIEQKLAQIGALRAQCQAQMLRHFGEVSKVMPAGQGARYLAEMRQLSLGFHEQVEQSMSPQPNHSHGHQ